MWFSWDESLIRGRVRSGTSTWIGTGGRWWRWTFETWPLLVKRQLLKSWALLNEICHRKWYHSIFTSTVFNERLKMLFICFLKQRLFLDRSESALLAIFYITTESHSHCIIERSSYNHCISKRYIILARIIAKWRPTQIEVQLITELWSSAWHEKKIDIWLRFI